MYRQEPILGEHKDDHFEQVPGLIGADDQLLRRIAVRIEVDDDEWVIRGVTMPALLTPCRRAERWISTSH